MEVAHGVADITCIAQVTFKFVDHALSVNDGWFLLLCLEQVVDFAAHEGLIVTFVLLERSSV